VSKPYILVVDDEPDIRQLVREILEDEAYEVATAENAVEARRLYAQHRPDLALLDIWMPDVDGITLLKEWVDGLTPPFPVIMMSGHATVETAVEATRTGAFDFLEKPLSLARLLLTVERALESARLRRENQTGKPRSDEVAEPVGRSAVIEQLKALPHELQWRVLEFTRALAVSTPHGVPGRPPDRRAPAARPRGLPRGVAGPLDRRPHRARPLLLPRRAVGPAWPR